MEQLEPQYWNIEKLFAYSFKVPVYQRPYSWESEQVKTLFDDIWNSYSEYKSFSEEKQQKENLYIGNIIIHKQAHEVYNIIDGQQRITTLSIFLLCLYSCISRLRCDVNHGIFRSIKSVLWKLDNNKNPVQDKRVLELGSIEKDTLIKFFNETFTSPEKLEQFVVSFPDSNTFEKNLKQTLIEVFKFISEKTSGNENKLDELLQFSKYILEKVYVIAIINEDNEFKAYSIFESINSKGKKLEDIDLIKTKIFSTLSLDDCKTYSGKWGDLIIKTEDELYDYLMIFIKSNVKYYTGNITYKYFKGLNDALTSYYDVSNIDVAYKLLIDDLYENVESYIALKNCDVAYGLINDNTFKTYYLLFNKNGYIHPLPLFFKCFCELKQNIINKECVREVLIEVIKFCICFNTIAGKDSKDAIPIFKELCEFYHTVKIEPKPIDNKHIIYKLSQQMELIGLGANDLINYLSRMDVFDKNKQLGAAIISIYESRYESGNVMKVSWDESFSKYSTYGITYTLDHIMNQTPKEDDANLKYFEKNGLLHLKAGHDFPKEFVHEGMEYNVFKSMVLHKAGNLRLMGGDSNSSRGRVSDATFNTYKDLEKRNNDICKFIVDEILKINPNKYVIDVAQYIKANKQKISGTHLLSESDIDFTWNKPKQIRFEYKNISISTNREIIITVIKELYRKYPEIMKEKASAIWSPRERIILSFNSDKMTVPVAIENSGMFIETNLSARDTIFYTKKILEDFNVDLTKIEIVY